MNDKLVKQDAPRTNEIKRTLGKKMNLYNISRKTLAGNATLSKVVTIHAAIMSEPNPTQPISRHASAAARRQVAECLSHHPLRAYYLGQRRLR